MTTRYARDPGSATSAGSMTGGASICAAGRVRGRFANLLGTLLNDEGSATAEYAVATMAAVGFAGLLVVILRGDEVRGILTDLVRRALTSQG
jgi:Protein of unknown function (DUF4244)